MIVRSAGEFDRVVELLYDVGDEKEEESQEELDKALIYASSNGHDSVAGLLIEHGANPNASLLGNPVLHVTVAANRIDVVPLLIQGGADKNAKDAVGRTALHKAVQLGLRKMVRTLVEEGREKLDLSIYDSYQKSILRLQKILRRHKRKIRKHHHISEKLNIELQ